jgi:hypothetical protein
MQNISHNNLADISFVTKGIEKYRKNTKVRPVNGTTHGKNYKSKSKLSICGNFLKNKNA